MARTARQKSESGIYHVMLRGCGKQCLFEDDANRIKFLEILSSNTEKYRVSVLAWCLMDNHIHLVLSDRQDDLSPCLKAIAGHYAMYFNSRTAHVGHVFQDRFKSKPIETDGYLLQAVRYVHRNPEKAGIAAAEDYPWSSYAEYLSLGSSEIHVTDTSPVLGMMGGTDAFAKFHSEAVKADSYRFGNRQRLNDQEAQELALKSLGGEVLNSIKTLSKSQRAEPLRALYSIGLSVRQIERVTGIGRWSIERALG